MSSQIPASQPRGDEDDATLASNGGKTKGKAERKAKAKAKSKAAVKSKAAIKAKAAVTAKAKAKAAVKATSKAKAEKKDAADDVETKPSAKKGKKTPNEKPKKTTAKEKIRSWSSGLPEQPIEEQEKKTDVDEERDSDEDEQADGCAKDRIKARKFKSMVDANQVPDYVAKEWQKTLTMKVGKRAAQKALSDNFFTRNKDGKLVMNLQNKYFENVRDICVA